MHVFFTNLILAIARNDIKYGDNINPSKLTDFKIQLKPVSIVLQNDCFIGKTPINLEKQITTL